MATIDEVTSAPDVLKHIYTSASTVNSSSNDGSKDKAESKSTDVDPNDLPLTLFESHPILQIRKKIRLVETLASRARYRFWIISKCLNRSNVLTFRGRVAMVRPDFVSERIEAIAIAGPPLLDGARSWHFEITSGTATFGFCSGASARRLRFDDYVAGPTSLEFKTGDLVRVTAVCKQNSTIDLSVFWRASRIGHEHIHKTWTLSADVKNPCFILPAVGLTKSGSCVRILPSDEWKKSDLAGNVSFENRNLETLESTLINELCETKQRPHHTLLATLYTMHSSFYIYRNPRDSVSDITHTHMSTKLWTSVSCHPFQHHGTVMYKMKEKWIECDLNLIKSELVLSYNENKSSTSTSSKSSSSSTLIKLRLWNSSENVIQGSNMNVVAVSASPESSKSFCFQVICQETSDASKRKMYRFAAKNGRDLRLWINLITAVLDAAQWKRIDCSLRLLDSGRTCPDAWIDCSPAICLNRGRIEYNMPIVSSSTLRRWTVTRRDKVDPSLRFVFSQSSEHDQESTVIHFSSVEPQSGLSTQQEKKEQRAKQLKNQFIRERLRLQDLLPSPSEDGLVETVLKSVNMSFSEVQLNIKTKYGEDVWEDVESVIRLATSGNTKGKPDAHELLQHLNAALFRTTFRKRQDNAFSIFWQSRTLELDANLNAIKYFESDEDAEEDFRYVGSLEGRYRGLFDLSIDKSSASMHGKNDANEILLNAVGWKWDLRSGVDVELARMQAKRDPPRVHRMILRAKTKTQRDRWLHALEICHNRARDSKHKPSLVLSSHPSSDADVDIARLTVHSDENSQYLCNECSDLVLDCAFWAAFIESAIVRTRSCFSSRTNII